MLQSALILAVLGLNPVPQHSDSVRTLTADELQIYTVTIRDLLLAFGPAALSSEVAVALDPWLRPQPTPPDAGQPWSGKRLSESSLRALTRATGILRICEPAVDNACRGSIRGTVLRLSDIRFSSPDSGQVVLFTTAARSELDNTVLVPRVRSYTYEVARQPAGWAIRKARRAVPR